MKLEGTRVHGNNDGKSEQLPQQRARYLPAAREYRIDKGARYPLDSISS